MENGWVGSGALIANNGIQISTLRYPHLSPEAIEDAVERMYRRFYFRPRPILRFVWEMSRDAQMLRRRLREGREFFGYLRERRKTVRARQQSAGTSTPATAQ